MVGTIILAVALVAAPIVLIMGYMSNRKFEARVSQILKNKDLSIHERMDKLVSFMASERYIVQDRSETQLQVLQKKKFNWLLAIIFICLWFVPFVIYLVYFLVKNERIRTFNFKKNSNKAAA